MKKNVFFISLIISFCIVFVHALKFMGYYQLSVFRDAPSDFSFDDLGNINAETIKSGDNSSMPAPSKPEATGIIQDSELFYIKMLDSCSQKFKVDTSSLKNSFIRMPLMTRKLFLMKDKICSITSNEISDSNCASIALCLKNVVAFEKESLGNSEGEDDKNKLFVDIKKAVNAYKILTGKYVSYKDPQDENFFKTAWSRFVNSGDALFNPDHQATDKLKRSIYESVKHGKITQAELIHESILAANGNLTMGSGSLAQILHDDRGLISKIERMINASGKNYYRFVGLYTGLHENTVIRTLGTIGGYGNILGNPVVYGSIQTVKDFWSATKFALEYYGLNKKSGAEPVDFNKTLKTFGPDGNGNLVDKIPEYSMGLDAAFLYKSSTKGSSNISQ